MKKLSNEKLLENLIEETKNDLEYERSYDLGFEYLEHDKQFKKEYEAAKEKFAKVKEEVLRRMKLESKLNEDVTEEYDDYGSSYYDDPLYGCGGY